MILILMIALVAAYNFLLYVSVAGRLRDRDKEIARLHAELTELYQCFAEDEPAVDDSEIAIAKCVEADFLRRLRHLN